MAQLVVRNLDDVIKARLQRRASLHGHSMEQEIRNILRSAVSAEEAASIPLGSRLRARFADIGLTGDIEELRGEPARPVTFDK